MNEAYFGAARCGGSRLLARGQHFDAVGAESQEPAGGALSRAGSVAGEAVR